MGDGGFKHLVLEVHYLEAQDKDVATQSGLVVHLEAGIPRRAMSVLAFAQGFSLPPQQPQVLVPNTCCYSMAGNERGKGAGGRGGFRRTHELNAFDPRGVVLRVL